MPTHIVPTAMDGQRLDRFLKKLFPHVPYVGLQRVMRLGFVRVNGGKAKPDQRLNSGDEITYPLTLPAPVQGAQGMAYVASKADVQALRAMVVFEDSDLLVLNKPAGLASQAGGGVVKSLDRLVAAAYVNAPPKLTHRLDRDTTGLIVLAKNRQTAAAVTAMFAAHEVKKIYLLLVQGHVLNDTGELTFNLKKVTGTQGPRVVVAPDGDVARTTYKVLARLNGPMTLVTATPHTGRMNQLRAHFLHMGHGVLGDRKYFDTLSKAMTRRLHPHGDMPLYLHAWELGMAHPKTGKMMHWLAPLPDYFRPHMPQDV